LNLYYALPYPSWKILALSLNFVVSGQNATREKKHHRTKRPLCRENEWITGERLGKYAVLVLLNLVPTDSICAKY